MTKYESLLKASQFVAEKVLIAANKRVPVEMLQRCDIRTHVDVIRNDLVFMLDTYMVGIPKETIDLEAEWPEDWWEAFRERWFPAWWLKRWPVKCHRIALHTKKYGPVCPHLDVPDKGTHLAWLSQQEEADDGEVPAEE